MRIFSKYKDYYDGVLGFGASDPKDVYVREMFEYTRDDHLPLDWEVTPALVVAGDRYSGKRRRSLSGYPFSKGKEITQSTVDTYFCGQFHHGIQVTVLVPNSQRELTAESFHFFWDADDYLQFIGSLGFEIDVKGRRRSRAADKFRASFAAKASPSAVRWLIENKIVAITRAESPAYNFSVVKVSMAADFRATSVNWIKDFPLREIEFFKKIDAWTAYQEIEMRVGGVLANNPPLPVALSEKDMLKKHGMDKWSFRKMGAKSHP